MKKLVLVTGSGRGIGQAIALSLVKKGFAVSGCARSTKELEETQKLSEGKMRITPVDVKDRRAIETWINTEVNQPDVTPWGIVTAAGVYGPIGSFVENDWNAWKDAVDINLYGTVICCQFFAKALLDRNLKGRMVLLSGGGATKPIENLTSYCATKAAVVRFGETLAKELESHGITVNSIAPGLVASKLHDDVIKAGPQKAGADAYQLVTKLKEGKGQSPEFAANLCCYLMSDEASNVTGRLISAVWDKWDQMHDWNENLRKSDVYTLRRIIPEDRGL